ncbi:MAG: hypothetical protein KC493_17935 [Bacteriovoracaceae bacterium]|nr:hypothetical protein [Bacteriovoracaceae bacterium]
MIRVQKLYQEGKYKQALEKLKSISETYVSAEIYYDIGLLNLALGKRSEAEKSFERSIVLQKRFYPAYESLLEIYIQNDNYTKAQDLVTTSKNVLVRKDYLTLEGMIAQYQSRREAGKLTEAYTLIQKNKFKNVIVLLKDIEDSFLKNYYAGFCYSKLGQRESAINEFEKAYSMNSESKEVVIFLANLYEGKGDVNKAISYLQRIHNHWGSDLSLSLHLVRLYESQKKYEEALKVAREIEHDYSHNKEIVDLVAGLYMKSGEYKKSLQKYLKSINIQKNDIHSYFMAELLYLKNKNRDKAIGILEKARTHFPQNTNLLNTLSSLYLEDAKYKKSITVAKESYSIDSNQDSKALIERIENLEGVVVDINVSRDDFLNIEKVSHRHLYDFETVSEQIMISKPHSDKFKYFVTARNETTKNKNITTGVETFAVDKMSATTGANYTAIGYYLQFQVSYVDFEGKAQGIASRVEDSAFDASLYGQYSFSNLTTALGLSDSHYFQQEGTSFAMKDLKSIFLSQSYKFNEDIAINVSETLYDYEVGYDYNQFQLGMGYQFSSDLFISNSFARKNSYEDTWNYHLHFLKDFHLREKIVLGVGYDYDQDFSYDVLSHRVELHGRYISHNWNLSISTYGQKFFNKIDDEDFGINLNLSTSTGIF